MRVDVFRILRDKKYDDGTCERRMIGLEDDIVKAKAVICKDLFNKGLFNTTVEDTEAVVDGKAPGVIFSCSAKIDDPWYLLKEIRYYIIKDHREG
jgi:hypothetical protein